MNATKKKILPQARLVPQANCPYKQEDVDIIGPALLAIAEKNAVDVPQLTAKVVQATLEKEPKNPLWKYINTDSDRAMRAWVLSQIDHLMSCVRVEYADIPEVKPTALFISVKDTSLRGTGGTGRAKVVSLDAFDKTGLAHRIADEQVKRLRQAYEIFRSWEARATLGPHYVRLLHDVGAAFDRFEQSK